MDLFLSIHRWFVLTWVEWCQRKLLRVRDKDTRRQKFILLQSLLFRLINTSLAELCAYNQSNTPFRFVAEWLQPLTHPSDVFSWPVLLFFNIKGEGSTWRGRETLWITCWSIKTIQHGDNVGEFRVWVIEVSSIVLMVGKGSWCRSSFATADLTI